MVVPDMIKSLKYLLMALCLGANFSLLAESSSEWQSPETVEGTVTISLEQAKEYHGFGMVFIDVRSPRQYSKRHIPGAINLFIKDEFTEANLLKHVKKNTPFAIYCNGIHCSLSYKAAEKAVAWGFTQVKYFREGARGWRLAGNELEYGQAKAKP